MLGEFDKANALFEIGFQGKNSWTVTMGFIRVYDDGVLDKTYCLGYGKKWGF